MAGSIARSLAVRNIRDAKIQLRGLLAACLVSVIVATIGCQALAELPFKEDYELLRSVKIGTTENDIRAKLGAPTESFPKGTPPKVYCLSGRACEERPVTGKVLVYVRGEPSAYYFLDPNGRVEHVFVGGS